MLLTPLPQFVEYRLLDRHGRVARPDSLQINLISAVDLSQRRDKLSHPLSVFLVKPEN